MIRRRFHRRLSAAGEHTGTNRPNGGGAGGGWMGFALGMVLWMAGAPSARAALQFDVFLGFGGQPTGMDGAVHEAGWFALGCEVHNDGPGFNAVVEVSSADSGQGQTRRLEIELPTNTRKRFVLPVFASGRGGAWNVRLLDERGKVRADVTRATPRGVAWESLLMGAVPRTFGGTPRLPEMERGSARGELQPVVARIPVELLPDNPIAYEGLDALYLNSEKALELREPQVEALTTWVYGGGHLVLAVEQPPDVTATPWLRNLTPCILGESTSASITGELYDWLRWTDADEGELITTRFPGGATEALQTAVKYRFERGRQSRPFAGHGEDSYRELTIEPEWAKGEFSVVSARLRDGQTLLAMDGQPLAVTAVRGRGRMTVLLFSPEREPFRSWNHQDWFWARLMRVPPQWYQPGNVHLWGGYSSDGVIGTMIDSRQVQKLPVRWLLLLLLAYLIVIGPLDQYVLKRLNRQMLTWVTFPAYVVLFSLLIYYIGYRLRAGETEWNELHIVDVVPRAVGAELRGRTYASIYSPVNARYQVKSDVAQSTLRGEFLGFYGGSREAGRLELDHLDRGFRAEVFVPVWTSQLVICDWTQPGRPPIEVDLAPQGANLRVTVRNHLERALTEVRLVLQGRVLVLGSVPAAGTVEFRVEPASGTDLMQQVFAVSQQFRARVESRQQALGSAEGQWLDLNLDHLQALSFVGLTGDQDFNQRQCVAPEGTDLTALVHRGDAVVLAWAEGYAATESLRRFEAIRTRQDTLFRITTSLGSGPSL